MEQHEQEDVQYEKDDSQESSSLALVPFTYCNNFIDPLRVETRLFCFPEMDDPSVFVKQKWETGGKGGTEIGFGASVYNSSYVLSHFLSNNVTMRDKNVCELGCGPGLASIVAGRLHAKKAIATDGDKISIDLCKENIGLNNVTSNVRAVQLLWGKSNKDEILEVLTNHFEGQNIDYIIASDVVALPYEEAYDDLLYTFQELSSSKSEIILVYQRRHSSENAFFDKFNAKFKVQKMPRNTIPTDFRSQPICIYKAVLKD